MEKHHIAYDIIIYGSFDQQDYQKKINNSIALIYLQESETQWLALQEAWIKDVPTLVWNRWYREYQWNRWYDDHISAPYLTHQAGLFFESEIDFEKNLQILLKKIDSQSFSPRAYCLEHLTDKICSENYLDIISKL